MAIANPRIHIICGICGCKDLLIYKMSELYDDDTEITKPGVDIICKNCGSLTGLEELMEEEVK